MSEQPFKQLAWRNRFTKHLIQPLEGVDCFQENVLLNPENNLIVLNLSEAQFLRLFTSVMTGAEISYPDESMQVVVDFLKGVQCPPSLIPEECFTLPTYANNIAYTPANPYIEPDTIPDGYLTQPFLVNGQNGNDFPTYEPFDVVVPFDAITFDIDFFEEIAGQLPTLEIMVNGQGSVNLKFLTSVQGGLVVVTLDNPPNLLDILAGIVTGAENIVDLNQDLVSLPPETAKELIYPVSVETGGIHTIYAVFLPILDDSLIPIRFGGGFRGLELCGFLPEGNMGIQNLRFTGCDLEQQNADGEWVVVDGWENWLDCVPSGGGGGGSAAIKATPYAFEQGGNIDTNSTTMVEAVASRQAHTWDYSNALIIAECQLSNTNAASNAFFEVRNAGVQGVRNSVQRVGGNVGEVLVVGAAFEGLTVGATTDISIFFRANANTARIGQGSRISYIVLEFADASELVGVEDIQYVGGVLQKKIGGVWINVVDIAGLIAPVQTTANNAAAAAVAAQSTANNALTVANGAVTVNNTQNTRLNNLESDVNSIMTVDIPQINLTLADHEARIDALEAALAGGMTWGGYKLGSVTDLDLSPSLGRYSSPFSTFDGTPAHRWWAPTVNNDIDVFAANAMRLGAACFVRVAISVETYVSGTFSARINGGQEALLLQNIGSGDIWTAWIPVLPNESTNMQIEVSASMGGNTWGLRSVTYVLLNFNPFTLAPL